MRYFLTVKYFLEGNRKAFFHYKRKTKRRTTRSLLNERTGYACSFINFLLDCFPATHCNFIAQTPTCPTNQLAPGSPNGFGYSFIRSFIHSFIADIYIAPLNWDCSEALPAPAGSNNVVLSIDVKKLTPRIKKRFYEKNKKTLRDVG